MVLGKRSEMFEMRSRRAGAGTSAAAALFGLLLSSPAGAGPADGIQADMATLRGHVDAMRAVRDRLLAEARCGPGGGKALVVRLVFPGIIFHPLRGGGLGKADLHVTLRRCGQTWFEGRGATPGWSAGPHFVDAAELGLQDDRLAGVIRVRLAFTRGKFNRHCTRLDVPIHVEAAVQGGQVRGTFRTPGVRPIPEMPWRDFTSDGVPSRLDCGPVVGYEGAVSGSVGTLAADAGLPPEPEEDVFKFSFEEILHIKAQWHEAVACRLYRQVHACALAIEHGMGFEHAWELTPACTPVRPKLQFPSRPDKPDKPTKLTDTITSDDLGLDDALAIEPKKITVSAAERRTALAKALRPILSHVERLRLLVEGYRPGSGAAVPPGGAACPDPAFGPWFGEAALPSGQGRPNVLPAEAGSPGDQRWHRVEGWHFLGPFPATFRRSYVPLLPEVSPAWDAAVMVDPSLRRGDNYTAPESVSAGPGQPAEGSARSGLGSTHPPSLVNWNTGLSPRRIDLPLTSFYGRTTVFSPAETELWLGITVNDGGALWINDRPVWVSPPDADPRSEEDTYLFTARFARGPNRLMLRLDNHTGNSFFSLRVCTRGRPRSAEQAARDQARLAKAYDEVEPPTRHAWGWRYDWSGKYPATSPPVAWDMEKKQNVLWRNAMGYCHTTPVVVGEKLFTSIEPHTLVCLDKNDGKVLWQRDCSIFEFRGEKMQQEAAAAKEAADKALAALAALGPGRREQLEAMEKKGLGAVEAAKKVQELHSAVGYWRSGILRKAGVQGPAWGSWTGHTISTPVTDGTHVWVKYNTGVAACFDLDGNRKWMVEHHGTTGTNGQVPSPLLVGDKLIMMVPDSGFGRVHDYKKVTSVLKAFGARTGRLLWKTPTAEGVTGEITGTPLPMRLTNGAEQVDVVVTADGTVVRADDGKVLRMHLGTREVYGSPVSDGRSRVFIATGAGKACYELILLDRDHVGAKLLWHVYHPGVGYDSGNYGLVHDGLLYAFGWRLDVLAAATAEMLSMRHDLLWIRPGRCYPPIAMAAGRLYVADYGQWFAQPKWKNHGSGMSVLLPGPDGLLLARNRIELLTGGPCFDGDRIYIRSQDSLMCLGYTGRPGRAYEADAVARELLSQLFPALPAADPPLEVNALSGPEPQKGGGWPSLWAKAMPDLTYFVGAFDPGQADAVRAELVRSDFSGITGNNESGYTMPLAGKTRTLTRCHQYNKRTWQQGGKLNVAAVNGGKARTVNYYVTVVHNDPARTMRLAVDGLGLRLWLGGREVRHNQLVELPIGRIPLVVEVTLGADAEGAAAGFGFWPSAGPRRDAQQWLADLERRRSYLDQAVRLSPDSDVGKKAKTFLSLLGP